MVEFFSWALLIVLSGLLVRIAHSDQFAPEFLVLCGIGWIRCVLWLSGWFEIQNALGYWYPVFQFLAAEESIRHSTVFARVWQSSERYWISIGLGIALGSLAWGLYPGGLATWRASAQAGIFSALAWSLASGLGEKQPKRIRVRHALLALILFGSLVSSRPGGKSGTPWTQAIHILAFSASYWTFPRRFMPKTTASISARRLTSAS